VETAYRSKRGEKAYTAQKKSKKSKKMETALAKRKSLCYNTQS